MDMETTTYRYVTSELSSHEVLRYSRQIVCSGISAEGQRKLLRSAVLIVGAGGLGCPAALYLATAGIGRLGIVDHDVVDISNLHRQILYTEADVGAFKSEAVCRRLREKNSNVIFEPYNVHLSSTNAKEIIKKYDVIIDASDNTPTRYLVNDSCVMLGKPCVMGSAVGWEGQVSVYNHQGGPCYRCLFPLPPTPSATMRCADYGVVGAVTGVIGSIQSLECIKVILGLPNTLSGRLFVFSGVNFTSLVCKLRGRQSSCVVCGCSPSVTELVDYEVFCGMPSHDQSSDPGLIRTDQRFSPEQYLSILNSRRPHVLLDIREERECEIARFAHGHVTPLSTLQTPTGLSRVKKLLADLICMNPLEDSLLVVAICKLGNDSQRAVVELQEGLWKEEVLKGTIGGRIVVLKDVEGGYRAWSKNIDHHFPLY